MPDQDPFSLAEALLGNKHDDLTVELLNGIVLKVKRIGQGVLRKAVEAIPKPKPPTYPMTDPETGEIEQIPNYDDPAFDEALEAYDLEVIGAALRIMTRLGTECLSVPPGKFRPEDDGWVDELDAAGIAVDTLDLSTPPKRYREWLELYASSQDDNRRLSTATLLMNGLHEQEVAAAVARFQSREARGADNGVPDNELDRHGDPDGEAPAGDSP